MPSCHSQRPAPRERCEYRSQPVQRTTPAPAFIHRVLPPYTPTLVHAAAAFGPAPSRAPHLSRRHGRANVANAEVGVHDVGVGVVLLHFVGIARCRGTRAARDPRGACLWVRGTAAHGNPPTSQARKASSWHHNSSNRSAFTLARSLARLANMKQALHACMYAMHACKHA
jgi:hypothetical protein